MYGSVTLDFDNHIEDHPGTTIKYDLTDVKLIREDGRVHRNTQNNHIDASVATSERIVFDDVPAGGYTQIIFVVENIDVAGGVEYQKDSAAFSLVMPRTAIRSGHHPEVFLSLDINKLNADLKNAFVVEDVVDN